MTLTKEDLHFSFVEYAGANITHWSFLDEVSDPIVVNRLCGRLLLITDNDNSTGTKKERQRKLGEKLGRRYICLKSREIENLLSLNVIKSVVSEYEAGKPEFSDGPLGSHSNESLGAFIETKLLKSKKRRGSYQDGVTISDKLTFCDRALKYIDSYEALDAEAKEVAMRIYSFIAEHNQ